MSTATDPDTNRTTRSVFGRILVGVDGSPEGREAARQAVTIAERPPTLMTVYELAPPVVGATGAGVPV